MADVKVEYEQVCFELAQKKNELDRLKVDIFVLNPDVSRLVVEISNLEACKKELEEQMNG